MSKNVRTQQNSLDAMVRQQAEEERIETLPGQLYFNFDMPAPVAAMTPSAARNACPECGADLRFESGCAYCLCGYSECPLGDVQD